MCLSCEKQYGAHGKDQIKDLLSFTTKKDELIYFDTTIRTFDNKDIKLNKEQLEEIVNHALVVISTGVDLKITIWAIQWPNSYIPKTIGT